ncbi:MAG: transglutaminase family protein [Duodenibacillus sp.]|nr:transglutaminase family protein [Duodenibacillus sp.]
MLLQYRLSTRLSFDRPVTDHVFRLRLTPACDERQRVVRSDIRIHPATPLARGIESVWGNRTHFGRLDAPHDALLYEAEGVVKTTARSVSDVEPAGYLVHPTPLTRPGAALLALCRGIDLTKRPCGKALMGTAMHLVHGAFTYTPGITTVATTAEEALASGRGVCQDYSHVLIALLRHCGMHARYVSGMMTGIGATHAWVEAWHEGQWIGLDPTHDAWVDEHYVVMARGADFSDAAIEHGLFKGSAIQTITTTVNVVESND